jgi:nicotinamide mononucleotide transporter
MSSMVDQILTSLQQVTLVEWVGTIFGLLTVWYSVKANILCWPTGMISVAAYAILFFNIKLYADTLLQIFFFIVSIIGWWQWSKRDKNDQTLPVTILSNLNRVLIFFLMIVCIVSSGYLFSRFTDAHIPFWDSTVTGMSVTAQLLLIRKKFENWILWIIVDVLSIGIYFYKEVYLTSFLYLVFLGMATKGFFEWKKQLQPRSKVA